MRAGVCQATWLTATTIGEEIGVTNWGTNTRSYKDDSWTICVVAFDISGITSINSSFRVTHAEEWACWI